MDFVNTDIIMDANLTSWLNTRDNRENIFECVFLFEIFWAMEHEREQKR